MDFEPTYTPKRNGISQVMVNGTLVVDNEVHTGALPGRALRSQ